MKSNWIYLQRAATASYMADSCPCRLVVTIKQLNYAAMFKSQHAHQIMLNLFRGRTFALAKVWQVDPRYSH